MNKSNLDEQHIKLIEECCQWINTNKRLPRNLANDSIEKKLGSWLNNRKTAKRKSKELWNPEYDAIAKKLGHPHLFDRIRCIATKDRVKMVTSICEFIKRNNNKLPTFNSMNDIESKYARWVANKRVKYNKNKVNQLELDIIKKYGLLDILLNPRQNTFTDKVKSLSEWIKINNKAPKYSDDTSLYNTYVKIIKEFNDKTLNPEFNDIFNNNNQSWIFDAKNLNVHEYNSNELCKKVNEYYLTHNKLPTQKDNYKLNQWISRKRLALKKIKGCGKNYESDLQLINQYNLYDVIFKK